MGKTAGNRIVYEAELRNINEHVRMMGAAVEEAMEKTIFAFRNLNVKMANDVMKNDDRIDRMENEIEEDCINIVVKQAPIASDWRKIATYMRMIGDLERLADNCSDICIFIKHLAGQERVEVPEQFYEMFRILVRMVTDTIDSFTDEDVELAACVIENDDRVDELFETISEWLKKRMKENPDTIPQYVNYLMIDKYIERMADHSVNIASWVQFIAVGRLVLQHTDRYQKESE